MAQWLDRVKFGNGKDGAPTTPIAGHGICSGTAGSTTLAITDANSVWQTVAGDVVLIHQSQGTGAGQWELNVATDTLGTGNHTMAYPLSYTYGTGAQIIRVAQFTGGTLSGTISPTYAWNGSTGGIIALMCNGDLTISGTITSVGFGFRGGSYALDSYQGEGRTGTGGVSRNQNAGAGGGGGSSVGAGGSYDGDGGVGGTNDQTVEATSPALAGSADFTKAFLGSAGGSGSEQSGSSGGGAIFIFAKNLTISGSVNGSGANVVGTVDRPAGGGSGSLVLIKCQNATLGTNLVTSSGGTAGGRGQSWSGHPTNGTTGRIHIDYADTYTGTTTPTIDATQNSSLKSQIYSGII